MKKIALIIPNNIENCPYIQYYINILESENLNYEIIEWQRIKNINSKSIIYYSKFNFENRFIKLFNYFLFLKFCKKIIKKEKYEKIIIFTIQLGVFFQKFLYNNYPKKYILDIRDFNTIVNYTTKKFNILLEKSAINVISSAGFKEWLPKGIGYILCHNVNIDFLKNINYEKPTISSQKKILTIGMIRDIKEQEKFIENFKEKYILEYRGIGEIEILKNKYSKYKNLKFYGKYDKKLELDYYKNSDFINIIVGNDLNSKTLLANRFYNALITNKYMIATKNTYMGNLVEKYQLGITFSKEFNDSDVDFDNLNYNNKVILEKIKTEQEKFIFKIKDFFKKIG